VARGNVNFAHFNCICQPIEQSIGSVSKPQGYVNDLFAVITLDLSAVDGIIDLYPVGATVTAELNDFLASIRQKTSTKYNLCRNS